MNAAPAAPPCASSPTTRATSCPGTLFFCVRGATRDGHAFAPTAASLGRVGARRRAPGRRARCRSSSCRTSARAMPAAATLFFGDPTRELDVAAITGHEREDDLGVPAARDPRGRRAPGRAAHEHRAARRRRDAGRPGSTRPRRSTCSGSSGRWLDAGDTACVMEATSIAQAQGRLDGHAVRGARVHEPDAGSPRLPRLDGGVLRGEARAVRAGRARRRQRRRRVRPAARGRAARRGHVRRRRRTRSTGSTLRLPRALQPRERDRRGARGARARRRRRRDPARDRVGRRRARAASSRSTRGSRSR